MTECVTTVEISILIAETHWLEGQGGVALIQRLYDQAHPRPQQPFDRSNAALRSCELNQYTEACHFVLMGVNV